MAYNPFAVKPPATATTAPVAPSSFGGGFSFPPSTTQAQPSLAASPSVSAAPSTAAAAAPAPFAFHFPSNIAPPVPNVHRGQEFSHLAYRETVIPPVATISTASAPVVTDVSAVPSSKPFAFQFPSTIAPPVAGKPRSTTEAFSHSLSRESIRLTSSASVSDVPAPTTAVHATPTAQGGFAFTFPPSAASSPQTSATATAIVDATAPPASKAFAFQLPTGLAPPVSAIRAQYLPLVAHRETIIPSATAPVATPFAFKFPTNIQPPVANVKAQFLSLGCGMDAAMEQPTAGAIQIQQQPQKQSAPAAVFTGVAPGINMGSLFASALGSSGTNSNSAIRREKILSRSESSATAASFAILQGEKSIVSRCLAGLSIRDRCRTACVSHVLRAAAMNPLAWQHSLLLCHVNQKFPDVPHAVRKMIHAVDITWKIEVQTTGLFLTAVNPLNTALHGYESLERLSVTSIKPEGLFGLLTDPSSTRPLRSLTLFLCEAPGAELRTFLSHPRLSSLKEFTRRGIAEDESAEDAPYVLEKPEEFLPRVEKLELDALNRRLMNWSRLDQLRVLHADVTDVLGSMPLMLPPRLEELRWGSAKITQLESLLKLLHPLQHLQSLEVHYSGSRPSDVSYAENGTRMDVCQHDAELAALEVLLESKPTMRLLSASHINGWFASAPFERILSGDVPKWWITELSVDPRLRRQTEDAKIKPTGIRKLILERCRPAAISPAGTQVMPEEYSISTKPVVPPSAAMSERYSAWFARDPPMTPLELDAIVIDRATIPGVGAFDTSNLPVVGSASDPPILGFPPALLRHLRAPLVICMKSTSHGHLFHALRSIGSSLEQLTILYHVATKHIEPLLAQLTSLRFLELVTTSIPITFDVGGLAPLKRLEQLQFYGFSTIFSSANSVEKFCALPKLNTLGLKFTPTDQLRAMPNLQSLLRMPQLRYLTIATTNESAWKWTRATVKGEPLAKDMDVCLDNMLGGKWTNRDHNWIAALTAASTGSASLGLFTSLAASFNPAGPSAVTGAVANNYGLSSLVKGDQADQMIQQKLETAKTNFNMPATIQGEAKVTKHSVFYTPVGKVNPFDLARYDAAHQPTRTQFISAAEQAPVISVLPRLLQDRHALPCCFVFLPIRELVRMSCVCVDFARGVKEASAWRENATLEDVSSTVHLAKIPLWQRGLVRRLTLCERSFNAHFGSNHGSFTHSDNLTRLVGQSEVLRGFERLDELNLEMKHWAQALDVLRTLFQPAPGITSSTSASPPPFGAVAASASKPLRKLHLEMAAYGSLATLLPIFQLQRLQQLQDLSLVGMWDAHKELASVLVLPSIKANLTSLSVRNIYFPTDEKDTTLVDAIVELQSLTAFTLLSPTIDLPKSMILPESSWVTAGVGVEQRNLHRLRLPPSLQVLRVGEDSDQKQSANADFGWIPGLVGGLTSLREFSLILPYMNKDIQLAMERILLALKVKASLHKVIVRFHRRGSVVTSACLRQFIHENASRLTPLALKLITQPTAEGDSVCVSAITLGRAQQQAKNGSMDGWEDDAMQLDSDAPPSAVMVGTFSDLMASFSAAVPSPSASSDVTAAFDLATVDTKSTAHSTSPLLVGLEHLHSLTDLALEMVPLSVGFLTLLHVSPLPRLKRLHIEIGMQLFECEEDTRVFWAAIGAHGKTLENLAVAAPPGQAISLNDTTDRDALLKLEKLSNLMLTVDCEKAEEQTGVEADLDCTTACFGPLLHQHHIVGCHLQRFHIILQGVADDRKVLKQHHATIRLAEQFPRLHATVHYLAYKAFRKRRAKGRNDFSSAWENMPVWQPVTDLPQEEIGALGASYLLGSTYDDTDFIARPNLWTQIPGQKLAKVAEAATKGSEMSWDEWKRNRVRTR